MSGLYTLKGGEVRPAILIQQKPNGKCDITVFLGMNDHGKGLHENEVRRGFAQLKDVTVGTSPGEFNSGATLVAVFPELDQAEQPEGSDGSSSEVPKPKRNKKTTRNTR